MHVKLSPLIHPTEFLKGAAAGLKLFVVFVKDVWHIAPTLFLYAVFTQIWEFIGMQASVTGTERVLTAVYHS